MTVLAPSSATRRSGRCWPTPPARRPRRHPLRRQVEPHSVGDDEVGSGLAGRRAANRLRRVPPGRRQDARGGVGARPTGWRRRVSRRRCGTSACVKPLDPEMIADAAGHPAVVTIEDGFADGGAGSAIASAIGAHSVSLEPGAAAGVGPRRAVDLHPHGKVDDDPRQASVSTSTAWSPPPVRLVAATISRCDRWHSWRRSLPFAVLQSGKGAHDGEGPGSGEPGLVVSRYQSKCDDVEDVGGAARAGKLPWSQWPSSTECRRRRPTAFGRSGSRRLGHGERRFDQAVVGLGDAGRGVVDDPAVAETRPRSGCHRSTIKPAPSRPFGTVSRRTGRRADRRRRRLAASPAPAAAGRRSATTRRR